MAETSPRDWLADHVLQRLGERFAEAGPTVVHPSAAARFGPGAISGSPLRISVEPTGVDRAEAKIRLQAHLEGGASAQVRGRAGEIDTLVGALATGLGLPPTSKGRRADLELPFSVHRLLGQAARREHEGELVKARLLYERAIDRAPEALSMRALNASRRLRARAEPELVKAALNRLEDAERRGDFAAALDAALDAVRFGARARRRWRVELPRSVRTVWTSETVDVAAGPTWVQLDPYSGRLSNRGRSELPPIGAVKDDLLLFGRGQLRRVRRDGGLRWRLPLPKGLKAHADLVGAGQIAATGSRGLVWIESSLGTVGQVAKGVRALALGEGGALVLDRRADVGLLRPGRASKAWTATVTGAIRDAAMTESRAVLLVGERLELIDAFNGRLRAPVRPVPPHARILAAKGRYAVVAGPAEVLLIDILGSQTITRVRGPGRAVGAHIGGFSFSVVFDGGDLFAWDLDGLPLDRAWVEGRPVRVLSGPHGAAGPIIETPDALIAFSELVPGAPTDVDLLLRAARAAHASGRSRDARVLVHGLAQDRAGRVAEVEELRARLLGEAGRADEAKRSLEAKKTAEDWRRSLRFVD